MSSNVPLTAVAKYTDIIAPLSRGAGSVSGNTFAGAGYGRVDFAVLVGTCKHTGATLAYSIFNATRGAGTYTLQTGTLDTMTAPTGGNVVRVLSAPIDPARPFIKLICTSATAWINYGAIAIMYGGSGPKLKSSETTPKVI